MYDRLISAKQESYIESSHYIKCTINIDVFYLIRSNAMFLEDWTYQQYELIAAHVNDNLITRKFEDIDFWCRLITEPKAFLKITNWVHKDLLAPINVH